MLPTEWRKEIQECSDDTVKRAEESRKRDQDAQTYAIVTPLELASRSFSDLYRQARSLRSRKATPRDKDDHWLVRYRCFHHRARYRRQLADLRLHCERTRFRLAHGHELHKWFRCRRGPFADVDRHAQWGKERRCNRTTRSGHHPRVAPKT